VHDILIKKGRVIDPVQGLDKELDIGICGDKIAALAADIPPQEGRRVLDVEGRIVTAGIIDLHCHVYPGIFVHGIEPDIAGVSQGVTTVVDGGSAGYATFGGFPKYVSPSCLTTVYCFLHLGATGQSITPELMDWDEINVDAMTETIESNRDIIKGIKLRMVGRLAATAGVKLVATAKKVANHFNLPIMVHIGDDIGTTSPIPQNLTRDFLPLMEAGDILTHVYTGKVGNILRHDSEVLPELREAKKRGGDSGCRSWSDQHQLRGSYQEYDSGRIAHNYKQRRLPSNTSWSRIWPNSNNV